MEFPQEFEQEFITRTLSIVQQYEGPNDATLLINCLLGLLVVPRENFLNQIPVEPISKLKEWGISESSIAQLGTLTNQNQYPDTIRGVVYNLRNAVAHFNITPIPKDGKVYAFRFRDRSGFDATVTLDEIRQFVQRLAVHLQHKSG